MKKTYTEPKLMILSIGEDIITHSETVEFELPAVKADAANDQQQQ